MPWRASGVAGASAIPAPAWPAWWPRSAPDWGSACCRWAASGPSIACLARRPASRPSLAWKLALYARPGLDSAGRTLRDRLRDLCDARLEGLQGER